MPKIRKTFILDTSVLLYDKNSIHSFPGNDVVLPLVVLDELDRKKEAPGLLGESARYINRYLDNLRTCGKLNKGVKIDGNQTVRVELDSFAVPNDLDQQQGDNKIIGTALFLKKKERKVIVVTKDINFRVKCDALGIQSEDYHKDTIKKKASELFSGVSSVGVNQSFIDEFYEKGSVLASKHGFNDGLEPNQFIVAKCGQQSLLAIHKNNYFVPVESWKDTSVGINPRNKEQKFALHLLQDQSIPLVSITGIAGSGKTFLTLMAAITGMTQGIYERVVITRSMQPVGRDIGFLPGGLQEKMAPWIAPIIDNYRHGFKDKDLSYFELMMEKGKIEVAPMSFIRGRTFADSFIIVDESQNSSIHELKTVITRVGENSKIVLLGDIEQIDTPYLDTLSNGLTVISEKLRSSELTGHVTLVKGERSPIATMASKLL
jgi:PhoH-like ATPase